MDPAPYMHYKNAKVAKVFPGYGLYEGYVWKIEKDDDGDDKIFFVKYNDGDREWVDLKELEEIVVKEGNAISYVEDKKKKKQKVEKSKGAKRDTSEAESPAGGQAAAPEPAKKRGRPAKAAAPAPAGDNISSKGTAQAKPTTPPQEPETLPQVLETLPQVPATSPPAAAKPCSSAATKNAADEAKAAPSQAEPLSGLSDGPTASQLEATLRKVDQVAAEVAEIQPQTDVVRLRPSTTSVSGGPADQPPAPVRYCEVVICKDLILMAGQIAKDRTGPSGSTYEGQLQQVLSQIDGLLKEAGASKSAIVSTTVYLRDIAAGGPAFDRVWDAWIDKAHPPVRIVVEAKMRLPDALLEVSIIATNPGLLDGGGM